jgi:hypothetical protein
MMGPTSEATSALHFSYINLKRFATNRIVDVVPEENLCIDRIIVWI